MKIHCKTAIVFIFFLTMFAIIKTDSVCDLNMLLTEISQDLADNGMLDCLRVIDPPHFVDESEDQKNLRLAAQWDTACAFEAETNWKELISKNYGINQLVDSIGDPVAKDFDNQADICEIIRAAVAKNLFKIRDLNMQSIPESIINKIDCVGSIDRRGPRICAASGTSYFQQDSWSIFLNPSYIKFSNIPKFVRERKRRKKRNNGDMKPTQRILANLLKLKKKDLINNEAKIAKMIDKEVSDNQEPEHQKEKSKVVHVHVKRTSASGIKSSGDFTILPGSNISFKLDSSRLVFAFAMISFKLKNPGKIFTKYSFNGREIPETRQGLGLIKDGSMTMAFAEVVNPKGKELEFNILVDSNVDGIIDSSRYDHNLSYGAITMPVGPVYKHINSRTLVFKNSESWIVLESFDLNINYTGNKEAYFMIMYNFGIKLNGKDILHTRLNIDSKPVVETSLTSGPLEFVGNHSGRVVKLNPGRHTVKLEYQYVGEEELTISDFTDAHYTQSAVAFQLPPNTVVNNYALDKTMNLNTNQGYRPFGMNINLNLTQNKTVLFIFNVNLKTDGGLFTIRLRMGNKFNKKSVLTTKDLQYGRASGYVVRVLLKGSYSFDLDFMSDSKSTYNPETADSSVASLQIIEMD